MVKEGLQIKGMGLIITQKHTDRNTHNCISFDKPFIGIFLFCCADMSQLQHMECCVITTKYRTSNTIMTEA